MPIRIVLILLIFVLVYPSSLMAATTQRVALVIGNSTYSSGPLKNPVNDAVDIDSSLKKLGFDTILKKNASMQEMENAIRDFGNRLKRGGDGLFYYAGHGVQINGKNYLIPIGARIEKETDAKYQAIDAEMVLDEMANAGNAVNIIILDACRDNPLGRSMRSASRGLTIISDAPKGTFITYSTSPGKTAEDGVGRNSPYTKALLKYMNEPGLPIEQVFKKVRQNLDTTTRGKQVPWELSSLKGDFYFKTGSASKSAASNQTGKSPALREESSASKSVTDDLDTENRKLAAEEGGKPKKVQPLAMVAPPSASTADKLLLEKAKGLSLEKALKIGEGRHMIIEFTDPNCPPCRKAFQIIKKYTDATHYIFFFPLSKKSEDKVRHILCATDRGEAYNVIYSGEIDEKSLAVCTDDHIESQIKFHREQSVLLGIESVPFFIIDGNIISGMNIPQIEKVLGTHR